MNLLIRTFNKRAPFYDTTYKDDLLQMSMDYKGPAMAELNFMDILLIHVPSSVWAAYNNATYGTACSADQNNVCPFDDPGTHSSLGINVQTPETEWSAVGYGRTIGNKTGTSGNGENYIQLFIR